MITVGSITHVQRMVASCCCYWISVIIFAPTVVVGVGAGLWIRIISWE